MTIRELLVELGVDADTEEVNSFVDGISRAKVAMLGAVAAGAAVAAAIAGVTAAAAAAAYSVAQYATDLIQSAQAARLSVEAYQRLRGALQTSGLSADDATKVIQELSTTIREAAEGSGEASKAFERLGISVRDASGNVRSTTAIYQEAIEKLSDIEDESKRAALAQKIFGDNWRQMMPLIEQGKSGLDEFQKKAEAFGLIMGEKAAQAASDFQQKLSFLWRVVQGLVHELGVAAIPIFEAVVDKILAWIKVNRDLLSTGIRRFAFGLAAAMKGIVEIVEPLGDLLLWMARNAQVVAAVLGGTLIVSLGALVGLMYSFAGAIWSATSAALPWIAAIAVVSVIVWDLINVMQTGESAILSWLKSFDALRPVIQWIQNNLQAIGAVLATVGAAVAAYLFPFWGAVAGIAAVLADVVNVLMGGNSVILSFIQKFAIGRQIISGLNDIISAMVDYFWALVSVFRAILPSWRQFKIIALAALGPVIAQIKITIRWFQLAARILKFTFRVAFAIVRAVAVATYQVLAAGLRMFANLAAPVFNAVWQAFVPVAQGIRSLWQTVIRSVLDKIDALAAGFDYIRQQVANLVGIELGSKTQTVKQKKKAVGAQAAGAAGQKAAAGAAGRARKAASQAGPNKVENKTEVGEINVEGAEDPEQTAKKVREEIRKREEETARQYKAQKRGQEAGQRGGGTS